MKNRIKILGIIALIVVIGFGMIACKTDSDDDPLQVPRDGNWVKNDMRLIFNGSNFTLQDEKPAPEYWRNDMRGDFSINGTSITFNFSEQWEDDDWETMAVTKNGTVTKLSDTSFSLSGGNLNDYGFAGIWNKQ